MTRNRIPQWIVLCFFLAAVVFSIFGRLAFGATMFLPPLRAAVPFTVIKDGVASICVPQWPDGTVYRDGVMTVPTTCGVDTVFHNGFGGQP